MEDGVAAGDCRGQAHRHFRFVNKTTREALHSPAPQHAVMHAIRDQPCSLSMPQLPARCMLASSTEQHRAVSTLQLAKSKECTWEAVEVGCTAESTSGVRKRAN